MTNIKNNAPNGEQTVEALSLAAMGSSAIELAPAAIKAGITGINAAKDKLQSLLSKSTAEAGTLIDDQVMAIQKAKLPDWVKDTFKKGNYTTVVTDEEITLYRTFGGKADAGGAFATTKASANRIQSKIDLALLPEWGNSRMYEATIKIPKGTILNIGQAASQTTKAGQILKGGADQVLLPQGWSLNWIQGIKIIQSK